MQAIIANLMKLSDEQIDASMQEKIRAWPDPVPAISVLEVLDACVDGSLASGFVITVLDVILQDRMMIEGTTIDELVKLATWRY